MSTPTTLAPGVAPWLLAHATACAEAVTSALALLDDDEVDTVPDLSGEGFTLEVHADPPRAVRALRWTAQGWTVTADSALRRAPRWTGLGLPADADPLELCEALRAAG
ncbi:hypothetical protein GCM10023200_41170 [Actinomycetospora chlora]|uniref:Uncharacterized protein n=1 Tax=Actinomycetospora chlora TaxID=663608 RepID=A0ABP9BTR6_9PSEU